MRHYLLSAALLSSILTAYGQSKTQLKNVRDLHRGEKISYINHKLSPEPVESNTPATAVDKRSKGNRSGAKISAYDLERIPLGESVNPFTVIAGQRTNLYADPSLNAVTFTRRGGSTESGGVTGSRGNKLFYDVSTDGGNTWAIGRGPLYTDDDFTALIGSPQPNYGARYPQGLIWNPPQNTNPANARQVAFASVLTAKNGDAWGGMCYGSHLLANTEPARRYLYDDNTPYLRYISEGLTVTPNGAVWHAEAEVEVVGNSAIRTGKILLTKASVNPANGEMSLDVRELILPDSGSGDHTIADVLIAFSPNGQIGYVTILGRIPSTTYCRDSVYYPIFYKSIDGGETWNGPHVIDINDSPGMKGLRQQINGDSAYEVDQVTGDTNYVKLIYSASFEHDIAVDKDGGLHIIMGYAYAGARNALDATLRPSFTIFVTDFHMVNIHNVGGDLNTWSYFYIGRPNTFRGDFGAQITSDNRPQTCRSADGSRIYFAWFDTDTAYWAADLAALPLNRRNVFPDLMLAGVDVTDPNAYKTMKTRNVTIGSDAEGLLVFGNVSPNTLNSACGAIVPVSYVQLSNPADGPVSHIYLKGVCTPNADTVFVNDPATYDTELINLTIPVVKNKPLMVDLAQVSLYPNPAKDKITLSGLNTTAGATQVKVMDIMGRVVAARQFRYGEPNTTIDVANLKAGAYIVVLSKNGVTKTLRFIKE